MPTESRIPESELLLRVKQRINDGRLPVVIPESINAGFGTGAEVCSVCDQDITGDQVTYDVSDPRNSNRLSFHLTCYMIWQRECAERDAAERRTLRDTTVPHDPRRAANDDDNAGDEAK